MKLGQTTRVAASLLLGTLATTLAACSIARAPMMPATVGNTAAMSAAQDTPRKFGLTFDSQTTKVKYADPSASRIKLPTSADLRSKLSPIDDQGRIGACTGFTMVGLAEFRARQKGNTEELSPGFIYLMELKEDGNLGHDGGSRITTGMKVLQKYGTSPEALHPYLAPAEQTNPASVTNYLSKLPSDEAMKAAAANKIPGAKRVADLNAFKAAIAGGQPVAFGIRVFESFMSKEAKTTGVIPMPGEDENLLGGHAILAVGYDDTTKRVTFRNSWSPKWGDQGYGYLPYEYFRADLAGDAWVATN